MRYTAQNRLRGAAFGLILAAILLGGTGLDCDQNAQADFRDTATSAIADGLKTILEGLIDGVATAIQNAGDGETDATTVD